MNPKIWQLIKDYMTRSRGVGAPSGTLSKAEWDEYYNSEAYDRAEAAHLDVGSGDLEPWMREDESFNRAHDAYDEWLGSGGEPEYSQSWSVLQRAIEEEKGKKRKTKKLKKSSKGHSRYGRGGGTIPMDVLESKTAPRGLLGPRKRKY